jgi:hypothetical protein
MSLAKRMQSWEGKLEEDIISHAQDPNYLNQIAENLENRIEGIRRLLSQKPTPSIMRGFSA